MTRVRSQQESFWEETYAKEYINRNSSFDEQRGVEAWRRMLAKAEPTPQILECGCNIGRNLGFLQQIRPESSLSVIDISKPAFEYVTQRYLLEHAVHGAILEADLPAHGFDLVFTNGVLIHVPPDDLLATMQRMHDWSRRYILISEYFNRTPVMIEYRGERDRLFKRDFGRMFVENFSVDVVDYGFHWGHEFDAAGFDDVTWWLFEKREQ